MIFQYFQVEDISPGSVKLADMYQDKFYEKQ